MLIVCVVSVIEFVCVEDGDEVVVVCAKTRIDVSSAKQCVCETCARCVGSTVRPPYIRSRCLMVRGGKGKDLLAWCGL